MSYIWENTNIKRPFLIDTHSVGLSIEAQIDPENDLPVYVNPFLRFSDIFSDALLSDESSDKSLDNETFNSVTHYLAHSERLYGDILTNAQLYCLKDDIINSRYGETIKNDYLSLNTLHQKIVVQYMLYYQKSGERKELFDEIFMLFFGRLYQTITEDENFNDKYTRHSAEILYNKSRNKYYFYCAAPESTYNSTLFRLIKNLFADCTRKIEPIWGKYNFGIVGNEDLTQSTVPIVGQMQLL